MNLLEIISDKPLKFIKETISFINSDKKSHNFQFIKIDPDPTNIEVLHERLYLNSGEYTISIFKPTYINRNEPHIDRKDSITNKGNYIFRNYFIFSKSLEHLSQTVSSSFDVNNLPQDEHLIV
jgi:hypothetical protein